MHSDNPLIVQSDRSLLLDVHAPNAADCAAALIPFAELEKSPEHLHTYRLTALSLWNAASAGLSVSTVFSVLEKYSRYDIPQNISAWITETARRFGQLRLEADTYENKSDKAAASIEYVYLIAENETLYKEIAALPAVSKLVAPCLLPTARFAFKLPLTDRGIIKQHLITAGWPVKDNIPLSDGEPLDISIRTKTVAGMPIIIRDYQKAAAAALIGNKAPGTGFGTIVLPCGSGKTIVGIQIMDMLKTSTLIITTNINAVHQWIAELIEKTTLTEDQIAEYSGAEKSIRAVTIATYQILTWRPEREGPYPHFTLFRTRAWGLIIYDEVHLLPAPVFRVVAELQSVRRVGLTATLVREDGHEDYVFSLVGPKRYDVPWKELEHAGWIAHAECIEVRLDLPESDDIRYAVAGVRERHRIASENAHKEAIVQEIVRRAPDDKIIIIGHYVRQLDTLARALHAPLITGKTAVQERDAVYARFRHGDIHLLVVSKVANFAIDLPDASLAIQVSGTFGSRQEEAQRLGRILRPKERPARFFTLVTRNTVEEEFSNNRQKFLAEQGYAYRIVRYTDASSLDEVFIPGSTAPQNCTAAS
ncbi:MAG: DEAD/DEAH box helicase [Treponema sp.]|nr:DEAD/DEAH box helicase [Treponema sp.]